MKFITRSCFQLCLGFCFLCCGGNSDSSPDVQLDEAIEREALSSIQPKVVQLLLASAHEQTKVTRNYTQDYYNIPYPNGDVPPETGACTDVLIRAFRKAGIDLQKEVHE